MTRMAACMRWRLDLIGVLREVDDGDLARLTRGEVLLVPRFIQTALDRLDGFGSSYPKIG